MLSLILSGVSDMLDTPSLIADSVVPNISLVLLKDRKKLLEVREKHNTSLSFKATFYNSLS
jgi:hypothetical protein